MRFSTAALLLFFGYWSVGPAHGVRLFVNAETGDDRRSIQSAQSDTTPFRSISHAIQVAHLFPHGKPHVIDIASGTYSPSTTAESFPIQISERDIFVHTNGANLDAEGRERFFDITEEGVEFVLRNFTFVNGNAETGGVVSCQACTLRVAENLFVRNVAEIGGDLIYMRGGQLSFYNNIVRDNGETGVGRGLVEIHNMVADTFKADEIRNNTFHNNNSPAITTSGGRVDISSNIFSTGADPAIANPSMLDTPLVRYNLFWNWDLLFVSDSADSIKILKTVRDTLTLEEQGVSVPSFFTNEPDTVAQVGVEYEYVIGVEGDVDFYIFKARTTPLDASASLIEEERAIRFTPTMDDVGSHEVLVEIFPPGGGANEFLKYRIEVFTAEDFPDLTDTGPQVEVSMVPDTIGTVAALNALVPGWAVDEEHVGGNLVDDPEFFNLDVLRFELKQTSPARDAGNPIAAMNDHDRSGTGPRNDIGRFGGPRTGGTPAPGKHTELLIATLPDSVVVVGQEFIYDPVFEPKQEIIHVDFHRGPAELTKISGLPPHSWTPVAADTGKYLVEAQVYSHTGHGFHIFPLRVKSDNEPPFVVSTPPTQVFEDSLLSYRIEAEDQDGDVITFTLVSGPSGMVLDELGVLQWTPAQENVGTAAVEVRVTDSEGASSPHPFTLRVMNTNDPPVLSALPDTSIFEDVEFRLALVGFGSDVDPADSLSYALTTAPDMAAVDTLGILSWTPLQEDVGVNPVAVQVVDLAGAADKSRFEITVVEVDDPPVISGTPETTALEDTLYRYELLAVDEEGEKLSYEVATGPEQMSISPTGLVEWTPAAADTGEVPITLNASDPAGQTAVQSFTLEVEAVNDAPAIVRIPADSTVFFEPETEVTLMVRASDEEGDTISFTWYIDSTEQAGEADSAFSYIPDVASVDTVAVLVADLQDTTTSVWLVDGRRMARLRSIAEAVDFGRVAIGDTGSVVIDIVNKGHADLEISQLHVGDLAFSAVFGSSRVAVDDSTTLELRFIPAMRGAAGSTIAFATSDSDQAEVSVAVSGTGIVPTTVAVDADSSAGNQGVDAVSLKAGDRLALEMYAFEAVRVISYSLLLVFDPEVLEFVGFDVSGASLLAAAGNSVLPAASAPSPGQVLIQVAADPLVRPAGGDGFLGRAIFSVRSTIAPGLDTAVELREVELMTEGQTANDILAPALIVQVDIGAVLAGDFDRDGDTDFNDFFLFADHFGSREGEPDFDSGFDLNGDGGIGLDDFFVFADHFGASAKPVADVSQADALGLQASLEPRPRDSEVVELALRWTGEDHLRGFVAWLEYDPLVLQFAEYVPPDQAGPLVWMQPGGNGATTVAVALSGRHSPFANADAGALLFRRLLSQESEIRVGSVLSYVGNEIRHVIATAPAAPVAVSPLPTEIVLDAPYPNPFNPDTAISFFLPESERVQVRVIDLLGRVVRVYEQQLSRGFHQWRWDGRDESGLEVASGVYVIRVQIAGFDRMHKVTLLK